MAFARGHLGLELPRHLNRSRLTEEVLPFGDEIKSHQLKELARLPCVSSVIDAGTIAHPHFLDIMVLAPQYQIGLPFLYNAVEEGSLTAVKYGSMMGEAIRDLHSDGVQITSIVGENIPWKSRPWRTGARRPNYVLRVVSSIRFGTRRAYVMLCS
jgi:hypothetical protein